MPPHHACHVHGEMSSYGYSPSSIQDPSLPLPKKRIKSKEKKSLSLCLCLCLFEREKKMEKPSAPKHERKPSIETEPKTLRDKEMNLAREAAIEVINNNTPDEAEKIFLKGWKPVVSLVKMETCRLSARLQ